MGKNQPTEGYFYYNFATNLTRDNKDWNYETIILEVNSDDDICMTVSIQNVSCPVFDTDQDITFRGFYETVNRKGGITISKYNFPHGFYVVFVAKSDDFDCTGNRQKPSLSSNRVKNISLTIKPSITYKDYLNAMIVTVCIIGAIYVLFGSAYFYCSVRNTPRQLEYVQENDSQHIPNSRIINTHQVVIAEQGTEMTNLGEQALEDSISLDEAEYDIVNEIETDREVRLCRGQPYLTDLARKDPRILRRKSYLYLYNVLTIAVFYGLPVIQLVIASQKVLNETGQQDLCFYNFLCAHPLGLISDFNHLFSNIGYILFGVLYLVISYNRERTHRDINFDRHFGIPQHYGLFYAMGVALIMEGVLSGSYHICPTQANFQFDSSFMYVMAVLCMIKLYQNRHPDINASAYVTFGVLAIAILLEEEVLDIVEDDPSTSTREYARQVNVSQHKVWKTLCENQLYPFHNNLTPGPDYTIFKCRSCIKIYYMGCWRINRQSVRHIYNIVLYDFWSGPLNILKPCYRARFVLLTVGNLCNWGLAFVAIYFHPKNFAVFLLAIFMANTLLYFVFYIVMKYLHKEKVRIATWIFLLMSILCAITAMYFFLHKGISWSKTAAQSRQFNKECILFRFYDYHDVWHFLSAIGMFFTFMVLLTLDDDLSHTHHSKNTCILNVLPYFYKQKRALIF
ncbi:hypothetical protein NQ317_009005 [Molorchus minor]|uniref:SID1 transmembrane family member 1-like n=1 Tax=Molorchus minor TaxID=1323400 RepID=A0ABQ9JKY5_9CUCU|nr:hypothetical protein NQ317_009005 [Molorchus minor]